MKIKKIEVQNFKAISSNEIELNGCSAIVTAGNNKGKSSLLRGLKDRMRGLKPSIIVKEGEKNGFNIIELTDGSIIEWSFTDKTEKIHYTTKEGITIKSGVISEIGKRYFGLNFDIDKFINSTPREQSKQLAAIVGLDFAEIDSRYKEAYDNRTMFNKELKNVISKAFQKPVKPEMYDIEKAQKKLDEIRVKNAETRKKWITENDKNQNKIIEFNNKQYELNQIYLKHIDLQDKLLTFKDSVFADCINYRLIQDKIESLEKPKEHKELTSLVEPIYLSEDDAQNKVYAEMEKKNKHDFYLSELERYNQFVNDGKLARENAEKADEKVKSIEAEKRQMINNANIPSEFEFTDDGILYNGLPLDNQQISSSQKYIAALKLGSMVCGEVKTLHFDASFLDKNSLSEVMDWAEKQDMQLLIERPDFEAGEIQYQIIQK